MKRCIGLVVGVAACNGQLVDLGGHETASVALVDAGAARNDAASEASSSPADDASSTSSDDASFDAASCAYSGPYSDGSGYLAAAPASCSAPSGTQESFTSVSDVVAALVGTWVWCESSSSPSSTFVRTIDANAAGITFGSDGTFTILEISSGSPSDLSLLPGTGPSASGTFVVLDASATLGPGTYQARLSALNGGVYTSQVAVFGATARLRFFSPSAYDYVPALTKAYQANVCGPPFGPVYTPTGTADALARIQGRWAACPNADTDFLTGPASAGQGVEFPGDGTWYTLVEDGTGTLVRSTDPSQYGELTVTGPLALLGPSPTTLSLSSSNGGYMPVNLTLGECGAFTFEEEYESTVLTSYNYVRIP
jgi:hypothetical protein